MIKVYGRKMQIVMECNSLEVAYEGLRKGTYKIGEYWIVEPSGKKHRFEKYICHRKSC